MFASVISIFSAKSFLACFSASGTELTRVGAGLEYYPLKDGNKNLRFHLYACQAFGKNGNPAGTMLPEQTFVDLGVKFKVDILSLTNKIF